MSNLHRQQAGYTIVEMMIVLVISAALFVTAIVGYTRQNNRTQFTTAVRELELKIQDVLNDVQTGYYPNQNNIKCVRSGGASSVPNVTSVAGTEQGTNNQCIFVGRAFDLRDNGPGVSHNIYTIVGLSYSATAGDEISKNVDEAANRLVDPTIPGAVEVYTHQGSINILKAIDATNATLGGFAIISGFGSGNGGGRDKVSIAKVDSYVAGSAVVDTTDLNHVVTVCVEEAGGGSNARRATIKIGDGSLSNIKTTIDDPADWAAGCGATP